MNTKLLQYPFQEKMMKNKAKYLLLVNGDQLFASVDFSSSSDGFLKLEQPLKLIISEMEEVVNYSFSPWIPFTDSIIIALSAKSITTIASLNEENQLLYQKALKKTQENDTENIDEYNLYDSEIGYLN